MSNAAIIIISGLLGVYISWKIYNIFVSLDDAIHLSTFSYYMKKIGAALTTGAGFMFISAMYLSKDVPSKIAPSSQTEQNIQQTENKPQDIPTVTLPIIEKSQENIQPTSQVESTNNTGTQEAEKEKQ